MEQPPQTPPEILIRAARAAEPELEDASESRRAPPVSPLTRAELAPQEDLQEASPAAASDPAGEERAPAPLRVEVSSLRCPFCHEKVPLEERCACAECLAVHHSACWDEHPRCAACAGGHVLVLSGRPVAPPPRRPLAERRPTDFPLPDPCYPAAAATYLGVTLHRLNTLIASGTLPARQVGGEVVFRADHVRALRPRLGSLRERRRRPGFAWRQSLGVLLWWAAIVAAAAGAAFSLQSGEGLLVGLILALPAFAIYVYRLTAG